MKASLNCIELIKVSESFRAKPYYCPAGIPTIGYGSTRDTDGKAITMLHAPITEQGAANLMLSTLVTYEDAVNRYVQVPLTQNQYDALVDFCYNAGAQNLRTSTLLKLLNTGNYKEAAEQFGHWIYAHKPDGTVVKEPGLIIRRQKEKELFNE